jgi:hypothetical protein
MSSGIFSPYRSSTVKRKLELKYAWDGSQTLLLSVSSEDAEVEIVKG